MDERQLVEDARTGPDGPLAGARATPAATELPEAAPEGAILFFCQFGGAKSVIAAAYFNRLASEQALPHAGVAVAAEEPYDAVPVPVAAFLESEGFAVGHFKPRRAKEEELKTATKLVTIDCDLAGVDAGGLAVERWDDVPKVSVDLDASAAAIMLHVEALVAGLRERR